MAAVWVVVLLMGVFFVSRLPVFRPYDVESGTFVAQVLERPRAYEDGWRVLVCPQHPKASGIPGSLVLLLTSQTSVSDQRLGVRLPTNAILLQQGQQIFIRADFERSSLATSNLLPAQEIVVLASDSLPVVPRCMNPSLAP
jgi:hypothetical protein